MEQKSIRDFILNRSQQIVIGILLGGAFIGCSILILRRLEEERQFVKIERASLSTKTQEKKINIRDKNKSIKAQETKKIQEKPKNKIININTAGKNELMSLHGIGEKLAERILKYRKENGPFTSIEDIMKVKGIGPKKFERWKDKITVD